VEEDIISVIFNHQISNNLPLCFESCEGLYNGQNMIESFIIEIYYRYRIKIKKWNPNKKEYPNYMLLGGDKGILAYLKFISINKKLDFSVKLLSSDYYTMERLIAKVDSDLDRPTFIIYLINCNDIKTILFETNEEIKDRILNDKSCININESLYMPDFHTIGSLTNLVDIFKDLKKNNVKVY
jgi:hypothetical protein